jgi:Carboxypeptidase regulatory-like domain/TonB dependent receptor/TonB-dependent Receptor Plug Domain
MEGVMTANRTWREWYLVRRLVDVAALLLIAGSLAPVFAQGRTATLFGKVADASGGVMPGVTITLASQQLVAGQQTTTTNDVGQWRVPGLPPGTYTVTAELQGFAPAKRERVTVDAGDQIGVDLTLTVSTVTESVTVRSEAPVVDVRSAKLSATVDQHLISNLPIQRTYADVITTMPGITDGGRYTYSLTQTVHGSSVRDNDYQVDGMSMKATSGYAATEISIEALQEVQVTTGGISAEFGQASGGVLTFITKSGGDRFSGTGYYYFLNESLQGNNLTPALIQNGILLGNKIVEDKNWGGNFGGPLKKKSLWFFADFARSDNEQSQAGFPDPSVRTALGDKDSDIVEWKRMFFGKGTWQVSQNNRLAGSYDDMNRWMLPSNPGAQWRFSPAAWRKQYWLPKLSNIQWTSVVGSKGFVDVQGGKMKDVEDNTFPYGTTTTPGINGYVDSGSGIDYGTWDTPRGRFDGRDHWDLKGSFSYYANDFLGGSHDLKAGAQRTQGWLQRWADIPNNLLQRLNSARTCFSLTCAVPNTVTLYDLPADTQSAFLIYAGYIQDQWTLSKGLTLNLGLRFEHENGWTPEERSGADLKPNGFSPDLDGNTYTFPTIAWFPSKVWPQRDNLINWNTVAPRLGASWDPSGTGRFVVKGSYGRWYNQIATDSIAVGDPVGGNATYNWLDCRNAAGTPVSCLGLPAGQVNGDKVFSANEQGTLVSTSVRDPSQTTNLVTIDPKLKQPYVDAVNLGFEYGLGPDFSVGVSGIYKKYGNNLGAIDPTRPFATSYDAVQVTNPATKQPMTIYLEKPSLGSIPTQSLLTNPPDAKGDYKGVELVVRKRLSNRWQLLGSYLWGRAYGNIGTHYNDGIGFNETTPNAIINSYGPLALDSTHQVKLNGSYVLPYDITFAVAYLGMTGYPAQPQISDIGSSFAGATYYQFTRGVDYPATNAAGQQYRSSTLLLPVTARGTYRVDFRNIVNVRVEKSFDLGSNRRLGLLLDGFNIFNTSSIVNIQTQRIDLVNSGLPQAIDSPRRARLGIRFTF